MSNFQIKILFILTLSEKEKKI